MVCVCFLTLRIQTPPMETPDPPNDTPFQGLKTTGNLTPWLTSQGFLGKDCSCYFVGRWSWLVLFFEERRPRGHFFKGIWVESTREMFLNSASFQMPKKQLDRVCPNKKIQKVYPSNFQKKQSKHISLKKRWQKSTNKKSRHVF